MNKKTRAAAKALETAGRLKELYPDALCSLEYNREAWRLLIMGRLSAQCTDLRVNKVSETLFRKYKSLDDIAKCDLAELEETVKPCGLYHTKAKSIKETAEILVRDFGGRVPDNMDDLLLLPGIGRKIANLILGDIYHKGGIVTDTHLIRICGRLGFYPADEKNPLKVEKIMTPLLPADMQSDFCHRIVLFGRQYCTARSPSCGECPLAELCEYKKRKKTR